MSEYQYHEWQTVDRLLTPTEQAAVNQLSSHIEVSSSKAVVTYNWGDFKHDPRQVLLKYFDAYFYQANWGSMRLMFRFPKGMLEEKELEPYWDGEVVSFETVGEYQVLDIDFNPEDGGWMEEVDANLSDFIPLRADLLQGDYRLLYLTWLKEAEKRRQAEEVRLKHIAEMKALAKREPQVWQEVDRLLETGGKIASVYDEVTALLQKLRQLSEFRDTRDIFQSHIHYLAEKYASRPSLMKRWRERGWI